MLRLFGVWKSILTAITVLLICTSGIAVGQTSGASKELWPKLQTTIELRPKTRLVMSVEKQSGEDLARTQWKFSVMGSYRMKRLIQIRSADIDDEKNYFLSLGGGYEHLYTNDNGNTKFEKRMVLQVTPHYFWPAVGLLFQDNSRIELRWVNDSYSTRYRNKVVAERPFKVNGFALTPYASGELFHDGKYHSWNENQYAFGVIIPDKKLLTVDTYFLHQNCTTCKEPHVNALGITVNIFLDFVKKKKK